ncbi:MAG: hypothetical protein PHI79_06765 [Sulfurovaceae bacterium]|nr:hypothetical protein [Sulfurovaceae bacterium]
MGIFDLIAGAIWGAKVGDKTREVSEDILDATLDPNREDELTNLSKDVISTGIGIATGLEVFDIFNDE